MPTIPFARHTVATLLAGLLLAGPAAAIDFSVVFGSGSSEDQCRDCISISDKDVTLDSGSYVTKGKLFIGLNGTGSLLQSGGSLRIPDNLYVGANDDGDGLYGMGGGSFTSEATSYFGYRGKGQLLLSGGSFSTAVLEVGRTGGAGSVFQTGGRLDVSGRAALKGGTYAQVGGVVRVGGRLELTSSEARYLLAGAGTVTALDGVSVVGGQFTLSGGTLNADLRVNSSFVYGGGTLNGRLLPQTDWATLRIQADLALQGALDNTGWLLIEGATLRSNSNLNNTGRIQARGGFAGSGALHNSDSFTLTGDFRLAASGAHRNEAGATWALAASKTLWLDGAGTTLLNLGTLRLEAGTIAGTGTLDNRGSVTGTGQVLAQLDNSGLVQLGAGTSVLGKVRNTGTIRLIDAQSNLEFSSLDNTGTLGGRGTVRSLTTNRGTLVADGGTLRLNRRLSNEAGGLVHIAGPTALLQLAATPAPNLGHILLQDGGQLVLERGELEQRGTLSGLGTVMADRLSNQGLIHLQAGSVLQVDNLRNEAGGELRASGDNYHVAVDGAAQLRSGSLVTLDGPQSRLRFLGLVQLRGGSSWAGNGRAEFLGGLDLDGASAMLVHTAGTLELGASNRLQLSIGGQARGSQYDALDAAGLALGGVLEISLAGGWMPRAGDRYDLFNGAWSGGFSSLDFSRAALGPGMFWDARDLASQGVLSVVSLGAAQDGSGLVRPPVPEPATWLLWACGLGLAAWLQRRRG